jgi:hypothetical protein
MSLIFLVIVAVILVAIFVCYFQEQESFCLACELQP